MSALGDAAARRAERAATMTRGAKAARPSQRRCDEPAGSGAWLPSVRSEIRLASAGSDGTRGFEGFASVTGQAYEMYDWAGPYLETVHVGAFTETLAQPGLDVPLVLDHVSSNRLARTTSDKAPLQLEEVTTGDTTGLRVVAPALSMTNPYVQKIVPLLESGLIDEMSFRFVITAGRWSDSYDEYHINAVDLHRGDVAIVGYGANPHTAGAGLRGQQRSATRPAGRDQVRRALRRELIRVSQQRALTPADQLAVTALLVEIAAAEAILDPIIDAFDAADCALDNAQATLSALLGLPVTPEDEPAIEPMAGDGSASELSARIAAAIAS